MEVVPSARPRQRVVRICAWCSGPVQGDLPSRREGSVVNYGICPGCLEECLAGLRGGMRLASPRPARPAELAAAPA